MPRPPEPATGTVGVLTTPRLNLRRFEARDAEFIMQLVNDADWLRFIGDKNVHSPADARRYIEEGPCASYARHGYGLYLVERLEDATPIGMCGLVRRDTLECADIGFAFMPAWRGQGYAHEAAAAVLDHARAVLGMDRILGITLPQNGASVRLLERLGLAFERTLTPDGGGEALAVYSIAF